MNGLPPIDNSTPSLPESPSGTRNAWARMTAATETPFPAWGFSAGCK